jgi:hemoglobin
VLPDLDSPARIAAFVDAFYARVFADPLLAPLFLDVAGIDPAAHLGRIKAYWCKMLLGDRAYRRNMVARHRDVHRRSAFTPLHYTRWLGHFEATLADGYCGPFAERAATLARRIAGNLRRNLEQISA